MQKETHKVGLRDVLGAFWKGIRPQKWHMLFTILASAAGSVLGIIIPIYYKRFFDLISLNIPGSALASSLVGILVIILVLNLVKLSVERASFFMINHLESQTMSRLRQMSFDYTINHSYMFFANSFSGALVQKVNRFTRSFERLYDTLVFNVIPLLAITVGTLIVVWNYEPRMAFIILIWILVVFLWSLIFSRWKVKYDFAASRADSQTTAVLADDISNQNSIILFDNFKKESDHFKKVSQEQARAQRLSWNLASTVDAVQILFIIMVEFFIFYYGVRYWQSGVITVGTFVLLQVYIIGLASKLWDFGRIIRNLYEAFADSKEMVEVLKRPHEVKNAIDAKELKVKEGVIRFEGASFSFYDNRPVFEGFNLEIKSGEKVALIGPSGAGKSTIIKTLLRMYDLRDGKILIDGHDIKKITQESLRKNISLVPQDPALFHRSLLENIRYGRTGATDEEVKEAARLAHCDEFIEVLPQKYETLVGERGIKLSGGERQRVAIARAILKNAPILILDEATSSLDSHSESLIQDALSKLMEGKTSIVIAHRLSTIRKMDRIIVVENGKIIEDGTHSTLLSKKSGLYKKLWSLQAGGFIKDE